MNVKLHSADTTSFVKNITIENISQKSFWSFAFIGAGVLFFIFSQKVQAERYSTGPWDRTEITRQNFIGAEAYLDKIGIPKEAKILVIDAFTIYFSVFPGCNYFFHCKFLIKALCFNILS